MSPEDVYAAHAETIESVLATSCRVHRLAPDFADEFRSWARLRLLDNDQVILRKFQGRSSLRTFLVTVIERLYLDWRNHEWGKWRPTSEARRLGELAIELERLILRDRGTFEEAAESLVARGLAGTRADVDRVWARLPRHPGRQRVDEKALAAVPARVGGADPVEEGEQRERARRLIEALERAVAGLPTGDQSILRLRYWSGVRVSRIAAMVGEEQKALYRRFERIWAELRQRLEHEGLSGGDLDGLLGRIDPDERGDAGDA